MEESMKIGTVLLMSAIAVNTTIAAVESATAQSMQNSMQHGMMQGGTDHQPADRGMSQDGMGQNMMCPMMRSGMMGSGMMGSSMMRGGMGALFGSRVTPVMNLSIDDVRGYLASQLEGLNNKRLKVADIKAGDDQLRHQLLAVFDPVVYQ